MNSTTSDFSLGRIQRGHPKTVSCELYVRRSKYCLEFFFFVRKAKNFQMTAPFMQNFRSVSNKFPTIFRSHNFSQFTPSVKLFFVEKRNPKFSKPKMRCREESEKFSFSKNFKLRLNFSGRQYLSSCNFEGLIILG